MAVIDDLVARIEDKELRTRIETELHRMSRQKKFGLVFENHLPECTPLYEIPVAPGRDVARREGIIKEVWTVMEINGDKAICRRRNGKERQEFPIEELVSVASFGDPIYPYLKPLDSICNAPDSDLWHTIIEADNFHALQLLQYLYAGKVDCIYIDPPYNTGAKDWKYNNNYVDSSDTYRHSKWLSFMEKRLLLAKRLLNPEDSVLIIAIDEKEVFHLGCLLEDIFPNGSLQMVTAVISAKGAVRPGQFSRVEEHIFFITFGKALLTQQKIDMLGDDIKKKENREIEWLGLRRREPSSKRGSRPNQFYPIFIDKNTGFIHSIGEAIPDEVNRETVVPPPECIAIWPLDSKRRETLWGLTPEVLRTNWLKGYVKVKGWNAVKQKGTIYYLASGTISDIESGKVKLMQRNIDGSVNGIYCDEGTVPPKRVWNLKYHNAETYGTNLVSDIIGSNKFSFPKSLYAVRDCLQFYVKSKPNALILDFFAGSGTTLHAVNLLNAEDKGQRRCILVTNNEVSEKEAKALTKEGVKPGQKQWNDLGIARHVTWPRTVCSIKGQDLKGSPIKGIYIGSERPIADGFRSNVAFFQLDFLDKTTISLGEQFKELLPVLWLKAGAHGPCPQLDKERSKLPKMIVSQKNKMAILLDTRFFSEFKDELNESSGIDTVYIVTNYERSYVSMISDLHVKNTYQLYRDYLDNFRINQSRN